MDFSAHAAAVIGYFPFIVAVPAAVAVICNHIDAAKRHPKIVYASCGLLALCFAFLLSRPNGTLLGESIVMSPVYWRHSVLL
jgi:hypothetical protein